MKREYKKQEKWKKDRKKGRGAQRESGISEAKASGEAKEK